MTSSSLLDPSDTFETLCKTLGIDIRLRKALSRLGYVRPTLVQSKCLPLAVTSGKDLLVRARTGTGKTLAYSLPLLHKILNGKACDNKYISSGKNDKGFVKAIVLAPTRELCTQVSQVIKSLIYYCDELISIVVLTGHAKKVAVNVNGRENEGTIAQQEAMLRDRPDVIVSTPAGLLLHIRNKGFLHSSLQSVESLIVDEADLILSFGYGKDISEIMQSLPKIFQGFIMSATLSTEINSLKKVLLHSPAVLKLEEGDESSVLQNKNENKLMQFYLTLPKKDKNLVLYVFLKLGILRGKGLFFVNTTDGGYRLKLFLEQFHIRSAVLNAELPLQSRLNIIEQYNVGNFDYLIATDESADAQDSDDNDGDMNTSMDDTLNENEEEPVQKGKINKKRRGRGKKKDNEYGVSRGLDFRGVSFVVNIDLPPTSRSYIHRIGRTARGGARGVALSFVEVESFDQNERLHKIQSVQPPLRTNISAESSLQVAPEDGRNGIMREDPSCLPQPSPLDFDLNEIESFRYRVEDVGRAVTKVAIRETRAAELRSEILNSTRLQDHFKESTSDLQLLRHDRQATHVSKIQNHLKHVPKYLLPRGMQVLEANKKRKRRRPRTRSGNVSRRKDNDPLQSFDGDVDLSGVTAVSGVITNVDNKEEYEDPMSDDKVKIDNKITTTTTDGTGKSTAGRNEWKQRHGKGKFSKNYNKDEEVQWN